MGVILLIYVPFNLLSVDRLCCGAVLTKLMTKLNLSDQKVKKDNIAPKLEELRALLSDRAQLWGRISPEKKKELIAKDPILEIAMEIHVFLKEFFGEIV